MRGAGNRLVWNLLAIVLGGAVLAATVLLTRALASDVGDLLTRNTVRLSLAWYAAAACLMLFLTPGEWTAEIGDSRWPARGWIARWCWTWGLVCFLVHLAMAFHYYHHWSHADAFERTRRVARFGEGIYVSYLFTIVWAADVVYWCLRPARYATRGAWIDRILHGFMLFIVLNGTIVFETGGIRWAGAVGLIGLAVAWWLARDARRARAAAA
ncbi:MAG TPA: hypothetical protein VMF30_09510 [Pirellulales bacterium]|nr:hypothetical protein [Pirellulales bacterium]